MYLSTLVLALIAREVVRAIDRYQSSPSSPPPLNSVTKEDLDKTTQDVLANGNTEELRRQALQNYKEAKKGG